MAWFAGSLLSAEFSTDARAHFSGVPLTVQGRKGQWHAAYATGTQGCQDRRDPVISPSSCSAPERFWAPEWMAHGDRVNGPFFQARLCTDFMSIMPTLLLYNGPDVPSPTVFLVMPIGRYRGYVFDVTRECYNHLEVLPVVGGTRIVTGAASHVNLSRLKLAVQGEDYPFIEVPAAKQPTGEQGPHFPFAAPATPPESSSAATMVPVGSDGACILQAGTFLRVPCSQHIQFGCTWAFHRVSRFRDAQVEECGSGFGGWVRGALDLCGTCRYREYSSVCYPNVLHRCHHRPNDRSAFEPDSRYPFMDVLLSTAALLYTDQDRWRDRPCTRADCSEPDGGADTDTDLDTTDAVAFVTEAMKQPAPPLYCRTDAFHYTGQHLLAFDAPAFPFSLDHGYYRVYEGDWRDDDCARCDVAQMLQFSCLAEDGAQEVCDLGGGDCLRTPPDAPAMVRHDDAIVVVTSQGAAKLPNSVITCPFLGRVDLDALDRISSSAWAALPKVGESDASALNSLVTYACHGLTGIAESHRPGQCEHYGLYYATDAGVCVAHPDLIPQGEDWNASDDPIQDGAVYDLDGQHWAVAVCPTDGSGCGTRADPQARWALIPSSLRLACEPFRDPRPFIPIELASLQDRILTGPSACDAIVDACQLACPEDAYHARSCRPVTSTIFEPVCGPSPCQDPGQTLINGTCIPTVTTPFITDGSRTAAVMGAKRVPIDKESLCKRLAGLRASGERESGYITTVTPRVFNAFAEVGYLTNEHAALFQTLCHTPLATALATGADDPGPTPDDGSGGGGGGNWLSSAGTLAAVAAIAVVALSRHRG